MNDSRTVVVGMNNPLSDDPRHALAPYPVNCAGWRLWRMLADAAQAAGRPELLRAEYMQALDRRNVLHARTWTAGDARRAGGDTLVRLQGRRVVICGVQTLEALQLPRYEWCEWRAELHLVTDPLSYCLIPHPSGRCLEYNDPEMRARVGRLLLAEYERCTP